MAEAERCHWQRENMIICDSPLWPCMKLAQFLPGGGLVDSVNKDSAYTL